MGSYSFVPLYAIYDSAGMKLAASIVKERLAACVNRIPGIKLITFLLPHISNYL